MLLTVSFLRCIKTLFLVLIPLQHFYTSPIQAAVFYPAFHLARYSQLYGQVVWDGYDNDREAHTVGVLVRAALLVISANPKDISHFLDRFSLAVLSMYGSGRSCSTGKFNDPKTDWAMLVELSSHGSQPFGSVLHGGNLKHPILSGPKVAYTDPIYTS